MTAMDYFFRWPLLLAALPVVSAVLCATLIIVLRPLLIRYALARPNVRSSHTQPTPQGGGIAVVAATIVTISLASLWARPVDICGVPVVLLVAVFLALVGAIDDIRPMSVLLRLVLQVAAVAAVLMVLPPQLRVIPYLPLWIERCFLLLGMLWFVNLVNFMDGLDWMTVAAMVPITIALTLIGSRGDIASNAWLVPLALSGALIGFAPFNRPVAKLFLGDVGSLPIGLLVGWHLLLLAGEGYLTAALLLPLYYLADATITLGIRLSRGEKVWMAHRSHFYQRATDNGFRVIEVAREVFILNIILAVLAIGSVAWASVQINIALLLVGGLAVGFVLMHFSRAKQLVKQ